MYQGQNSPHTLQITNIHKLTLLEHQQTQKEKGKTKEQKHSATQFADIHAHTNKHKTTNSNHARNKAHKSEFSKNATEQN